MMASPIDWIYIALACIALLWALEMKIEKDAMKERLDLIKRHTRRLTNEYTALAGAYEELYRRSNNKRGDNYEQA